DLGNVEFISQGNNLVGFGDGATVFTATGDQTGLSSADLKLGPLQNNGGPTFTMLPQFGSPAIDSGNNAVAPASDQRGVSRPQNSTVDIGAVEVQTTTYNASTNPTVTSYTLVINGGNLELVETGNPTNVLFSEPLGGSDAIVINDTSGNDTLLIDFNNGNPLPPDGIIFNATNGGTNTLALHGTGTEDVVYTPDATNSGDGTITIGSTGIVFHGLDPVDFDNVGTFALDLPGDDDVIDVDNGFNSATTTASEAPGTVAAL